VSFNMQPSNSPGSKMYAPDRDMAYLYPALLKEVFARLDEINWTSDMRAQFEQAGITEVDLAATAKAFGEALRLFIRVPTVTDVVSALNRSGFLARSFVERQTMYAKIGESMTAGFFISAKQVTLQGMPSPMHHEYIDAIAAATAAYKRLAKVPQEPQTDAVIERYAAELQEYQYIVAQQTRLLNEKDLEITRLLKELRKQNDDGSDTIDSAGVDAAKPLSDATA